MAAAFRFRRGDCLPTLYTPEQIDGWSIDNVVASSRASLHDSMELTASISGYKAKVIAALRNSAYFGRTRGDRSDLPPPHSFWGGQNVEPRTLSLC